MSASDLIPRKILIIGASGAIGGALAELYAQQGCLLYLHGRDEIKLAELATKCQAKGAEAETQSLDLRDIPTLKVWLESLGFLDLVIVTAGMNTHIGIKGESEPWDEVALLLDVNLKATMAIVQTVLPAMRTRGKGQIALLSSLAAYFGLALTPAYSASKAGIKAYSEALRGWLAPEGIWVNVIMPGYVKSPMCDEMPGPKPFLWHPKRAALIILQGLEKNKARISFPFPVNLGTWFLAVLPPSFSIRILRCLGYGV